MVCSYGKNSSNLTKKYQQKSIAKYRYKDKTMDFYNKVAVITGSHKGIGLAIARKLALQENIRVIITSRQKSDGMIAEQIKAEGIEVDYHQLDITVTDSITQFIEWITSVYGRIDILVNNAGVNNSNTKGEQSILTATSETMLDTFAINAIGTLRICQAVIPLMQQREFGTIVNVSTEMASLEKLIRDYYPLSPSYRVSKVALNAIATLLAKELKNTNILVNNYSPGWTKTDIGGENAFYTPAEAAETAVYLATLPDGSHQGGFFAEMRKSGEPVELPW